MNTDPREQARASDEARIEHAAEQAKADERSEVRQVPEAVAAADVIRRKDTPAPTAGAAEIAEDAEEAAEVERKLEAHRARGVEWVRPTDLINRGSASLAGRGIDLEVEMARKARAPMVEGIKGLGERARRLSPLSAFGHGPRHQAPTRAAVGKS